MNTKNKILHWAPRILAVLFVAFLGLFSLDGFNDFNGRQSALAIVMNLAIPAVILAATILAWKRDLIGAAVFLFFAVSYVFMIGLGRHWSLYAAISGPALLIAVLFFINWRRKKSG